MGMRGRIYKILSSLTEKFRPPETRINIKSAEHLNQLLDGGFKITDLEISLDHPSEEFDPRNKTIQELIVDAAKSNAASSCATITLCSREDEKPEILFWLVLTADAVEGAMQTIKEFNDKKL